MLVDTGADRTVLSANILEALDAKTAEAEDSIGGLGGIVETVIVATQIRLLRDDGQMAIFRGDYPACTDYEALDMSVLGRDILDMFASIIDRQNDIVTIIGGLHSYTITFQSR